MAHDRSLRLLVITGLSGSGKTSVLHALEDRGYFSIDNLPVLLLPGLLSLLEKADPRIEKLAVGMDIREGSFLREYKSVFQGVRDKGIKPEILFLEASTDALLRRFEETRRPHPLAGERTLLEGIEREKERLFALKQSADKVIDTTHYNIHQIRQYVHTLYEDADKKEKRLQLELISFSYPRGIPLHADVIVDMRFLPNPHYDPALKPLDGRDRRIQKAIQADERATEILDKFLEWVEAMVCIYEEEDRTYFNVGIGCTGGRHRSVAVLCLLEEKLGALGYRIKVFHRDL